MPGAAAGFRARPRDRGVPGVRVRAGRGGGGLRSACVLGRRGVEDLVLRLSSRVERASGCDAYWTASSSAPPSSSRPAGRGLQRARAGRLPLLARSCAGRGLRHGSLARAKRKARADARALGVPLRRPGVPLDLELHSGRPLPRPRSTRRALQVEPPLRILAMVSSPPTSPDWTSGMNGRRSRSRWRNSSPRARSRSGGSSKRRSPHSERGLSSATSTSSTTSGTAATTGPRHDGVLALEDGTGRSRLVSGMGSAHPATRRRCASRS